eukprot:2404238-Rhodomonas_salina.1
MAERPRDGRTVDKAQLSSERTRRWTRGVSPEHRIARAHWRAGRDVYPRRSRPWTSHPGDARRGHGCTSVSESLRSHRGPFRPSLLSGRRQNRRRSCRCFAVTTACDCATAPGSRGCFPG